MLGGQRAAPCVGCLHLLLRVPDCSCALTLWTACLPPSLRRSHVVVGTGGKLLDVQNGISPGDSFAQAAEFCAANKQA